MKLWNGQHALPILTQLKTYGAGKQYSSIEDLWNAITTTAKGISSDTIKKLTSSMVEGYFRWCQIMDDVLNINDNVIAAFFVKIIQCIIHQVFVNF